MTVNLLARVGRGVVATAAMTASTALERRVRGDLDHPIDYDASRHVVTAVESVLRRPARGRLERQVYFALAHWGYGSAVAAAYPPLQRRIGTPRAAAAYFAGCQAMAMTLLPVLGGAPPAHRWRRDIVASSLAQHTVYVAVVVALDRRARLATW